MRKKIQNHLYYFYMLLAIYAGSIVSCKKAPISEDVPKPESPVDGTRAELTLDSIYLYAKYTYLWNDAIPDYSGFNPRKYIAGASDFANFKKALFDLSQYKINPLSGQSYEKTTQQDFSKYSYLTDVNPERGIKAISPAIISDDDGNKKLEMNEFVVSISGSTGYVKLTEFKHLNELRASLNGAFDRFAESSVNTLIIDLRNNSGGYVETAQYLANFIATSDMQDKKMYAEHFNELMQHGNVAILKNQLYFDSDNKPVYIGNRRATFADIDFSVAGNTYLFKKEGKLNTVRKLYFIVNQFTASASELLINVLKPYFDVTLIGRQTYGKPVGSFGINIDKYTLYAVSFQIKNAEGDGAYFNGMEVDIEAAEEQIGTEPKDIFSSVIKLGGNIREAVNISRIPVRSIVNRALGRTRSNIPEMIKEHLELKNASKRTRTKQ